MNRDGGRAAAGSIGVGIVVRLGGKRGGGKPKRIRKTHAVSRVGWLVMTTASRGQDDLSSSDTLAKMPRKVSCSDFMQKGIRKKEAFFH